MEGSGHPIRLVVNRELRRSRLTVFFRLPLAVIYIIWLYLWGIVVYIAAVIGWLITLVTGTLPDPLHRFFGAYLRYAIHVTAFVFLAANPFPGFLGRPGSYPVDVQIDPPQRQNRWKTGFRLILAIPAGMLAGALATGSFTISNRGAAFSISLLATMAFLSWFVALVKGQITPGIRDSMMLALAYAAEELAYVLLLTDRYPTADPERLVQAEAPPPRWALMVLDEDDGRRNRLTVFFRLLLLIPHFLWLLLWSLLIDIVVFLNWVALLIMGRSPEPFHRLIVSYIRYALSLLAYGSLLAEPYPRFIPARDERYVVDVQFGLLVPQNRWKTLFRGLLLVPALLIASAYSSVLYTVAFLGWFASLVLGRMPDGLRRLGLACANYLTQYYAYQLLATDEYPYSGPSPSWEMPQSSVAAVPLR